MWISMSLCFYSFGLEVKVRKVGFCCIPTGWPRGPRTGAEGRVPSLLLLLISSLRAARAGLGADGAAPSVPGLPSVPLHGCEKSRCSPFLKPPLQKRSESNALTAVQTNNKTVVTPLRVQLPWVVRPGNKVLNVGISGDW